jgi:hypothetical protein
MRFPIRFTGANSLLRARMGWAFSLQAPLESVRFAQRDSRRVWSSGVHGWRGKWLVSRSSSGLVRIDLSPPARARALGVPISVRELTVSVEDPDGLVAALGMPGCA